MIDAPGSKRFFEAIEIPGVEANIVYAVSGCVYVILVVSAESDAEILRKQYVDACKSKIPITQEIVVSVASFAVEPTGKISVSISSANFL